MIVAPVDPVAFRRRSIAVTERLVTALSVGNDIDRDLGQYLTVFSHWLFILRTAQATAPSSPCELAVQQRSLPKIRAPLKLLTRRYRGGGEWWEAAIVRRGSELHALIKGYEAWLERHRVNTGCAAAARRLRAMR